MSIAHDTPRAKFTILSLMVEAQSNAEECQRVSQIRLGIAYDATQKLKARAKGYFRAAKEILAAFPELKEELSNYSCFDQMEEFCRSRKF